MAQKYRFSRSWISLTLVIFLSFAVLLYFGREIYRQAPPIPDQVVSSTGEVLYTGEEIRDGQNVWQSLGGQQMGTVWGHGAYVAPDWSADWLHRESDALLDGWAKKKGAKSFDQLGSDEQILFKGSLIKSQEKPEPTHDHLTQITTTGTADSIAIFTLTFV